MTAPPIVVAAAFLLTTPAPDIALDGRGRLERDVQDAYPRLRLAQARWLLAPPRRAAPGPTAAPCPEPLVRRLLEPEPDPAAADLPAPAADRTPPPPAYDLTLRWDGAVRTGRRRNVAPGARPGDEPATLAGAEPGDER